MQRQILKSAFQKRNTLIDSALMIVPQLLLSPPSHCPCHRGLPEELYSAFKVDAIQGELELYMNFTETADENHLTCQKQNVGANQMSC